MSKHNFDGPIAWLDFRLWKIGRAIKGWLLNVTLLS